MDTRQRVIDAACECFARYGYGPSTNNLIAEAAGVTAGSVYYHFGTKRSLFQAVCEDVYGRFVARSEEALTAVVSHRDLMVTMLNVMREYHRVSPGSAAFFVAAAVDAQRHTELAEIYARSANRINAVIITAIERGQAAGLTPTDIDPVQMAHLTRALGFGFNHLSAITTPAERGPILDLFASEFLRAPGRAD